MMDLTPAVQTVTAHRDELLESFDPTAACHEVRALPMATIRTWPAGPIRDAAKAIRIAAPAALRLAVAEVNRAREAGYRRARVARLGL